MGQRIFSTREVTFWRSIPPCRRRATANRPLGRLREAVRSVVEALEPRQLLNGAFSLEDVIFWDDFLEMVVTVPGGSPANKYTPSFVNDDPCPDCGDLVDAGPQLNKTPNYADGGDSPSYGATEAPVRYSDGKPFIYSNDLWSEGFGFGWGHSRSWSDAVGDGLNGYGWFVNQLPFITKSADGDHLAAVGAATSVLQFRHVYDPSRDEWRWEPVLYEHPYIIAENPTGGKITITDHVGNQISYHDFSSGTPVNQRGTFAGFRDPWGHAVEVVDANTNGRPEEIIRSNAPDTGTHWKESYSYEYYTSANANSGKIKSVTLGRKEWTGDDPNDEPNAYTNVRRVDFTYYDGSYGDENYYGNLGDLRTAAITDLEPLVEKDMSGGSHDLTRSNGLVTANVPGHGFHDGDTIVIRGADEDSFNGTFVISNVHTDYFQYRAGSYTSGGFADGAKAYKPMDVSYYRYYTSNSSTGFTHGLKYVFGPQSYSRLASGTANAMLGDDVGAFADNYFEYNADHRVTREIAQGAGCSCTGNGGLGEYKLDYTFNSHSQTTDFQPNLWTTRVEETLPDNTRNYVYLNEAGQVLLKVFQLGEEEPDVGDPYSGDRWGWFYVYDDNANLVMSGGPAALDLPSTLDDLELNDTILDTEDVDSDNNYGRIHNDQGLITEYVYGETGDTLATTSSAGAALGYLKEVRIRHGETGTAIKQLSQNYIRRDGTPSNGASASIYVLNSVTRYESDASGGSDGRTTSYEYAWHGSTLQVQEMRIHLPVVTGAKNGPGQSGTNTTRFDEFGQVIWNRDEDGFITFYSYDVGTGGIEQMIRDVDTTAVSNEPTGWATPSDGGRHLVTESVVDRLGRPTAITVKDSTYGDRTTYFYYDDPNHEVRTYRGWTAGNTTTGPIEVYREYRPLANTNSGEQTVYHETITTSATPSLDGSNKPTGQETISAGNIQSLSREITNNSGQTIEVDDYFSLSGLTYSTATPQLASASISNNSASGHYHATKYGYDSRGRQNRIEAHTLSGASATSAATITRFVYDGLGRLTGTWVGTDDTDATYDDPDGSGSPNNMKQVAGYEYDDGEDGGDSNLTKETLMPDGATGQRVTRNYYDWRDRLVASKSGVQDSEVEDTQGRVTYYAYDNMNRVTTAEDYDGDTVSISKTDGVPNRPSSSRLRAKTTFAYDERGQLYNSEIVHVHPTNGATAGPSLKFWYWYDARGNLIKSVEGSKIINKYAYDGAGRLTTEFITDGGGDTRPGSNGSFWDAVDRDGDVVLEQREYLYDVAGNIVFATSRQRFHNATNLGDLDLNNPTNHARTSFAAFYYDKANRLTDQLDVGTFQGSNYTRLSSVPARSGTNLVTGYAYDEGGRLQTVTNPRGFSNRTSYDLLGRATKVIEAFDSTINSGNPSGANNRTTNYTYDGSGHVRTMMADLPGSQVDQTTEYVYGVTGGSGSTQSRISSNDLLREIHYPDPTTGAASSSSSNAEKFAYNALGDKISFIDRNQTTHLYTYDVLGRLVQDTAAVLGSGVDGYVRRVTFSFDSAGRLYQATNYSATNGGTVRNQIQREYNGYGQLTKEYQEHNGSVNPASSSKVQYAYSEGGTNPDGITDNHSRLTSITYPNGRVLRYEYGSSGSLDEKIGRLQFLADQANGAASTHIEEYSYLGLSTPVIRNRPSANAKLSYVTGTSNPDGGDQYAGLDRFGRIVEQKWTDLSGTATEHMRYGYDANSNPLYKENVKDTTKSELYHANGSSNGYDVLDRLTAFRRGTLNGGKDTIADADLSSLTGSNKTWSLDAVGNWDGVTGEGRTHNAQNQITTSTTGDATFEYDANGNLTYIDKDGPEGGGAFGTWRYDAWNRLVNIDNPGGGSGGFNWVPQYTYDAMGRRINRVEQIADGPELVSSDFYYSDNWQVLEERENWNTWAKSQYVWSPFYVDELILRDRDDNSANDGVLDSSFSGDGKQTTDISGSGSTDHAHAVAIQPDGKVVAVGFSNNDFAIARYNTDGSLDTSFSGDGKLALDFGNSLVDRALGVAVQSDGMIVAAGTADGNGAFGIARFEGDGDLDNNFGTSGKKTVTIFSGAFEQAKALALQSNGKIIVAGTAQDGSGVKQAAVIRLNADGSLDTNADSDPSVHFGTDGIATTSVAWDFNVTAMALQDDGKVIVGGYDGTNYVVARFESDGDLDTTFGGGDGIATVGWSGYTVSFTYAALALQADGMMVVVTPILPTGGSAYDIGVARFEGDGDLDSTFGTSGKRTINLSSDDQAIAVRMAADGKIVLAGATANDFLVMRLKTDGTDDTTFDSDGRVTTNIGATDTVRALVIGSDYKITAVGSTGTGTAQDFALARYKVTSGLEERLYAQSDPNHNITSVVDVLGSVKERFVYDPYGSATALNPNWTGYSGTDLNWVYLHQGLRYDATAELYDNRERQYSPAMGRFVSADPLGYPDGAHRYQYQVGAPRSALDPLGLAPIYAGEGSGSGSSIIDPPPLGGGTGNLAQTVLNQRPYAFVNPANFGRYTHLTSQLQDLVSRMADLQTKISALAQLLCQDCAPGSKVLQDLRDQLGYMNNVFGGAQSTLDLAKAINDSTLAEWATASGLRTNAWGWLGRASGGVGAVLDGWAAIDALKNGNKEDAAWNTVSALAGVAGLFAYPPIAFAAGIMSVGKTIYEGHLEDWNINRDRDWSQFFECNVRQKLQQYTLEWRQLAEDARLVEAEMRNVLLNDFDEYLISKRRSVRAR